MKYVLVVLAIMTFTVSGLIDHSQLSANGATSEQTGQMVVSGSAPQASPGYRAIRLQCIDPKANAQFGHAVDMDGNYLVVGTCYDDQAAGKIGQVYVFQLEQGEWTPCAKLRPETALPGPWFGWSVSISGSRILVGTRGGPAHLFTRTGDQWVEECQLAETNLDPEDQFGWSVSLSGTRAVVGCWAEAVFVYHLSEGSWAREDVLRVVGPDTAIGFGVSVAADRDTILVGAPMDSVGGLWSGSAYVFTHDGESWIEEARLTASDSAAGQGFGKQVALSGDLVIVSAPDSQDLAGASYIFGRSKTGWTEEARLDTGCTRPCDLFGGSVTIDGNRAAVGACGVSEGDWWGAGAVYVFSRSLDRWKHVSTLTPPQRQQECFFGYTVALQGGRVLVGAHCQDCPKAGEDAGTAYVFDSTVN